MAVNVLYPGNASAQPRTARGNGARATASRPMFGFGVGGSGHRCMLHMKAAYAPPLPPWLRFLVLDSAHEDLRLHRRGQEVRMEPGSEMVYIGDVSIPAIMRNLPRLATLNQVFGETLRSLPRVTYREGVGGNRDAGCLSLHYHSATVEKMAAGILRHLSRQEGAASDELVQSSGINVVVCASACGGQGSGASIHLAYLLRELLAELGQLADNSMITGVFLLPDAFPGLQTHYLEANTVAFLQEMEQYMGRGGFRTRFPNNREIDSQEAPFDRVFLVGGIDQNGRTRRSHAEVCAAVGQMLYLISATPAGQKLENDFFNHSGLLAQVTDAGELACFGALGLATLRADGVEIQRQCAQRFAVDVARAALLAPADTPRAEQAAIDFMGGHDLEAEPLIRRLLTDPEGNVLAPDVKFSSSIGRRPPEEIPSVATGYVRDYQQVRVMQQIAPQIDANTAALSTWVLGDLAALMSDQLRLNGVRQAATSARALRRRLRAFMARWQNERETAQEQVEEATKDQAQAGQALMRAGSQIFLLRKGLVQAALLELERAAQAWTEAFINLRTAEAAITILAALERAARAEEQRLEATAERLEQGIQALARPVAGQGSSDGHFLQADINLVDAGVIERIHAQYAPEAAAGLAEVMAYAGQTGLAVSQWHEHTAASLAEILTEAVRRPFDPVAALGVEDLAKLLQEEVSPERWQNRLLELAVPLCNLEGVRLVDGYVQPVRVVVLGVPDDRNTLFSHRPELLVSTGDRTQVVALSATLGLPLSALKQWPAWVQRTQGRSFQAGG